MALARSSATKFSSLLQSLVASSEVVIGHLAKGATPNQTTTAKTLATKPASAMRAPSDNLISRSCRQRECHTRETRSAGHQSQKSLRQGGAVGCYHKFRECLASQSLESPYCVVQDARLRSGRPRLCRVDASASVRAGARVDVAKIFHVSLVHLCPLAGPACKSMSHNIVRARSGKLASM
jgi:Mg-chelatase subunit ChlD